MSPARDEAIRRGAKLGEILERDGLVRCEGRDPDGNPFAISNRA
jgi:hypothetical protein